MSGSRRPRRRRRGATSGSTSAAGPDGSASSGAPKQTAATTSRAPRASRLGIAFALFFGLFLGRAFSNNLSSEALGAIDLGMFAGMAATMALGFRRWARRTIEERERVRRRQQRAGAPRTDLEVESAEDTPPLDR